MFIPTTTLTMFEILLTLSMSQLCCICCLCHHTWIPSIEILFQKISSFRCVSFYQMSRSIVSQECESSIFVLTVVMSYGAIFDPMWLKWTADFSGLQRTTHSVKAQRTTHSVKAKLFVKDILKESSNMSKRSSGQIWPQTCLVLFFPRLITKVNVIVLKSPQKPFYLWHWLKNVWILHFLSSILFRLVPKWLHIVTCHLYKGSWFSVAWGQQWRAWMRGLPTVQMKPLSFNDSQDTLIYTL